MGSEQERLESDIARQRVRIGNDVDALAEKVSPGQAARRQVGRFTGAATSVKDRVMGQSTAVGHSMADTGHSMADTASGAAAGTKETLANAQESAADAMSSTADAARRRTEGNPLAVGLIAFGAGWLVSSLIPASKVERQAGAALREHAEEPVRQAGQQLGEKAKEVAEHLREPAQEAVGSVKQTATDAAEHVKEEAVGHSEHLRDEARDRANSVQH